MKKLVLGLLFWATFASATSIPIFSTGQGVGVATADPHWTYSLQNNSATTITGNPIVLSPPNVAVQWVTPTGLSKWVSTCDAVQTLSCLPGYAPGGPVFGAYTVPLTVTYSTTFSMAGLDPNSAQLTINWSTDDCGLTVSLNGVPKSPGFPCGGWTTMHGVTITSGFVAGTNTLSFQSTNADNGFEGIVVDVVGQANPIDAAQISYAANLGAGQSVVNLTNGGANGGRDKTDFICANVYVFSEDQQLISCCTCPLSPNDLRTLSVQNDLINNTLTPGVPTGVTIEVVASDDTGQVGCNAATVSPNALVSGLRAWGTKLHAAPGGGFAVTENQFSQVSLGVGATPGTELFKMTSFCSFIQADGSKFGICNSCTQGAQGAKKQ